MRKIIVSWTWFSNATLSLYLEDVSEWLKLLEN